MKNKRFLFLIGFVLAILAVSFTLTWAREGGLISMAPNEPLGSGFTYQGYLTDGGAPANGVYDFEFMLYDAEVDGISLGTTYVDDVTVDDGLFTVQVNFGSGVFDGNTRWLAIGVRPRDETGVYTPLDERQPITPAPYALYAVEAGKVSWSDVADRPVGLDDGDDNTTYDAGYGLELDDTTFSVMTDTIQTRVIGECEVGSFIQTVNADGSVFCGTDEDTTYDAGYGLGLEGTILNVLTDTLQTRVAGSCAVGSTIRAVNADGSVVCEPHDTLPSFTSTILDNQGDTGWHSSITIGVDGLPIISYYESTKADLKVAHCDDIACTSATINNLDYEGNTGQYPSITIGADGLPIISYYDKSLTSLKVAHCDDTACTSATTNTLDSVMLVGLYTSITIGPDGLPIISYYSETFGDLKAAHCDDIACTSASIYTLDSDDDVGMYTSITIGTDGHAVISYYDATHSDLKVAYCNTGCTSAGITALDTADSVGQHTSITIGTDGLPIISYLDTTFSDLKVAHCDDKYCISASFNRNYKYSGWGFGTSITIGADGLPIISHYHVGSPRLMATHCNDTACTSATSIILDTLDGLPENTSITIGTDGLPIISHYYYNTNELSVTHCSNPFCVPYWRRR